MSYCVLVVDDSSLIRKVIKKSLSMSGLDIGTVHEAGNGVEALEILNEHWIDIVFVDLNMPEMNGVELIDKMSEQCMLLSTPVVVVSSDRSEAREIELKNKGIRAYIKKPFRPESFKEAVDGLLGAEREDSDALQA